jgi:hypothetical protein
MELANNIHEFWCWFHRLTPHVPSGSYQSLRLCSFWDNTQLLQHP